MNAFRAQLIGFVLCTLTLALLGGCPTDSVPSEVLDALAGTYWVEYADGQLVVFALAGVSRRSGHVVAAEHARGRMVHRPGGSTRSAAMAPGCA